jgi:hypothetical protein
MAAAMAGGSSNVPTTAARSARAQLQRSRRNIADAQLAPIASTIPGPANTNSSTMP